MTHYPRPYKLPYSKPADLTRDARHLEPFYKIVDSQPAALAGQHSIRRWEYAMALYTIQGWQEGRHALDRGNPLQICDIGGAGSNFWQLLTTLTSEPVILIDPDFPEEIEARPQGAPAFRRTIESYAAQARHDQFDILTCISVIEHVAELRPFFRAARMLLKPGGLLFLTTDYWGAEGPDVAHFNWMRKRIYNQTLLRKLLASLRELGYASFGQADWAYPGNQLYDYSVVSAALVKV